MNASAAVGHPAGGPATPVLVVEDDPLMRGILRPPLEEEGLPVAAAEDEPGTVRWATGSRPSR